jgi:uncharacterized protein YndB with AHSA1/START domain
MSLKRDKGHRAVAMEIELSGTPEQVWQAIATGPGFSAWFTPTEIEEREGGAVAFHLGEGMTSRGHVTAWQPPKLIAFEERDWSGEAPPLATEITIEAQAGGTCKVRMVHSLFTEKDDWDNELASMENGWPPFFIVLRIYLRSFAGQRAASAGIKGGFSGTQDAAGCRAAGAGTDGCERRRHARHIYQWRPERGRRNHRPQRPCPSAQRDDAPCRAAGRRNHRHIRVGRKRRRFGKPVFLRHASRRAGSTREVRVGTVDAAAL